MESQCVTTVWELASFTQNDSLETHPNCMCISLFFLWLILKPSLVDYWAASMMNLLQTKLFWALMGRRSCEQYTSSVFWDKCHGVTAGSCGSHTLHFIRCQTVSQSGVPCQISFSSPLSQCLLLIVVRYAWHKIYHLSHFWMEIQRSLTLEAFPSCQSEPALTKHKLLLLPSHHPPFPHCLANLHPTSCCYQCVVPVKWVASDTCPSMPGLLHSVHCLQGSSVW